MKFLGVICSGLLWDAVRRKSPAIGNRLLWHSGRVKAGRCGDFDRTCHNSRP